MPMILLALVLELHYRRGLFFDSENVMDTPRAVKTNEGSDIAHRLLRSGTFTHPVRRMRLLETHISWVLLTGDFAYKIKKPVQLPFVDYSTLKRRAHFCAEEFRLNKELAPDIYLGVVSINGELRVEGDGIPIEYAVKMREFSQECIFARMAENRQLTDAHVDSLANALLRSHAVARTSSELTSNNLSEILHHQIYETAFKIGDVSLTRWLETEYTRLQRGIARRAENGGFRLCHGDMHLENVVWFNGKVQAFDCIEFSPELRCVDTINDLAFPVMDLMAHDQSGFAFRLLSGYLESRGDYQSLRFLPLYVVYRALVRAMCIRLKSSDKINAEPYIKLAQRMTQRQRPTLYITCGVSGSGKSTRAMEIVESEQAIRIRSDVERARLFKDESQRYSTEATDQVYKRLLRLSEQIVSAGFSVVVDATFLKRLLRAQFAALATQLNVPLRILSCNADTQILKQRIQKRRDDPSEAMPALVDKQLKQWESLSEGEQRCVFSKSE